jgi:hypothetical protein
METPRLSFLGRSTRVLTNIADVKVWRIVSVSHYGGIVAEISGVVKTLLCSL